MLDGYSARLRWIVGFMWLWREWRLCVDIDYSVYQDGKRIAWYPFGLALKSYPLD